MRHIMKSTTILFLISILFSSHAFAWTITADFENGALNTKAESPTEGFHNAAGHSRYISAPALSGHQAASVKATEGETGFGLWGGRFVFPEMLGEGDQVWYRANVYYPTGWDFSCGGCTEGLKFLRIHTRKGLAFGATNSNEGNHTILIKGNTVGGLVSTNTEVNNAKFGFARGIGTPVQRDQWHTYELYIKFSSIDTEGIYRVWQDGYLIYEKIYPTLVSSTSISDQAFLYSYWNNGAPKTQISYADDIVITNEVPGRKDAHGNPYIGVGASIYIAPPKPPSSVGK